MRLKQIENTNLKLSFYAKNNLAEEPIYNSKNSQLSGVDSVNLQNNTYSIEELKQFEEELNNFYKSKVLPGMDIKHPAKLQIVDLKGELVEAYKFETNTLNIDKKFLTNPNLYKLVSEETGKCLKNINSPILIIDTKERIEALIKYNNQNGHPIQGKIEKLTKSDMEKFVKASIFHETVHNQQFDRMRRTEGIGYIKIAQAFQRNIADKTTYFLRDKKLVESTWNKYQNEEGTIPKDSPIGRQSYKYLQEIKGYNINSLNEDYYGVSFEKEAYEAQYEFARKNNLEI